jgi:hypothetical protein
MGKHSNPSDPPSTPGNVTDDQWAKIMNAAVDSKNGDKWVQNVVRNAENARNN